MPYTFKSLAFVWLITLGLFALTASGAVAGPWLLLLLLVALAAPALVLGNEHPVGTIARSPKRPRIASDARDQAPLDPGAIDVYRRENEGGAAVAIVSFVVGLPSSRPTSISIELSPVQSGTVRRSWSALR